MKALKSNHLKNTLLSLTAAYQMILSTKKDRLDLFLNAAYPVAENINY